MIKDFISQGNAAPQQIVLQQPQQTAQIIQTPDGQTFIYQPMSLENSVQASQPTGNYFKAIIL